MSPEDLIRILPNSKRKPRVQAPNILEAAAGHLSQRAKTYDAPQGERSMGKTVSLFNQLCDLELTEEQGWLFMAILKMVRSQQGELRMDSYEDGAAYFALAGESAAEARSGESVGSLSQHEAGRSTTEKG